MADGQFWFAAANLADIKNRMSAPARGKRAEHRWNGDPNLPNYLSRLHYHTNILDRLQKTAPPAAGLVCWRY